MCVSHVQCVRVESSALGLNLYTLPHEVVRRLHLRPFRYCVVYYVYKGLASCTAKARVSSHVHSTCTSYVLYAYLYCVHALVGGAISIRDRTYICAVHESVPTNHTLSSTGPLSVQ